MSKKKAGIINVTGYAGVELARLLYNHPEVELVSVTGRSAAGKKLKEVFPHLSNFDLDITQTLDTVDVVFSAMPHVESAREILPLLEGDAKIIDISADFRLKNPADYPEWYNFTHPAPDMLKQAVYGLPELHRKEVRSAQLVANPGCYPTGAILALSPAAHEQLITADIIVDSKSGVSGAGRTLRMNSHYAEANEDISAYSLGGHRHQPEIVQELAGLAEGYQPAITFIPHLTPMTRGILTTAYAPLSCKISAESLYQIYCSFYENEPFVRVLDTPPHTKYTWGSNFCFIYPTIDERTQRLIVVSSIDNLVKGAAGQAIQNMNLMLGLPETTGIDFLPVYP